MRLLLAGGRSEPIAGDLLDNEQSAAMTRFAIPDVGGKRTSTCVFDDAIKTAKSTR